MDLSSRLESLPYSGIREMTDLARRTPGALRLEIGDPDFATPSHITRRSLERASQERANYPPTAGLPELREAIAAKLRERNGLHVAPEQVVVTVGATGALFLAFLATLDPGDEILMPDPAWAGYEAMVALAGGVSRSYPLDPKRDFALTAEAVREAVSEKTRVILVNSPNNPTGAVYERSELKAVADFAADRGITIITDECYEDIVFDGAHHSIAAESDISSILSVFSLSKTYAMTGWRIGYLAASPKVAAAIIRLQSAVVASASIVSQWAALEAISGPQDAIAQMSRSYLNRRDLVAGLLRDGGVDFINPAGAFYLMIDIRATGLTSAEYARALLQDSQVSTTPGSAFGSRGEGFVRLSLASSDEELREGVTRLITHHERLRN